jgi:hypothetical protein
MMALGQPELLAIFFCLASNTTTGGCSTVVVDVESAHFARWRLQLASCLLLLCKCLATWSQPNLIYVSTVRFTRDVELTLRTVVAM